MKRKRFLAAFLAGVLVLTQTAPALAADGFDAASSDAYYAENEDAYEDELESPDEYQEDIDAWADNGYDLNDAGKLAVGLQIYEAILGADADVTTNTFVPNGVEDAEKIRGIVAGC